MSPRALVLDQRLVSLWSGQEALDQQVRPDRAPGDRHAGQQPAIGGLDQRARHEARQAKSWHDEEQVSPPKSTPAHSAAV